ncbi:MAG: hypoxanthine-guanine phosphoribosyltransferase [Thiothrix sp.]|nr:hypoxanthine-guanine phosphoribosyltransferase [Thiothrix sp.]HPQ97381.1 hypoxanthine-guanine phosphoribosyltransferase [Thiolinea sp.]
MNTTPPELQQVLEQADCLYTGKEVRAALDRLADDIRADLGDRNPLLICIMNGGLVTMGQLLTRLNFPLQTNYLHATRYRGATKGEAVVEWIKFPVRSVGGRHILLVDDILDEGHTLKVVKQWCENQGAASVKVALLAEKLHQRRVEGLQCDYSVLQVPDRYVFGFGMDYCEYWRNADGIYALNTEQT